MKQPYEMRLRTPETPREITIAIARAAHTIWESHAEHGHLANQRTCDWTSAEGIKIDYQQFTTAAYGQQAYISYTDTATRTLQEFSIDLQDSNAEYGVAIGEANPHGYYTNLDEIKDEATRASKRLRVYQLLQDGLDELADPSAKLDEEAFVAIIVDIALDPYQHELNEHSVEEVVSKALSSDDDNTGSAHWLLKAQAVQKRAAERARSGTADSECE